MCACHVSCSDKFDHEFYASPSKSLCLLASGGLYRLFHEGIGQRDQGNLLESTAWFGWVFLVLLSLLLLVFVNRVFVFLSLLEKGIECTLKHQSLGRIKYLSRDREETKYKRIHAKKCTVNSKWVPCETIVFSGCGRETHNRTESISLREKEL